MPAQRRPSHLSGNPGPDHAADWDGAMRAGDLQAAWVVSDKVLAMRDPETRDDPAEPYHERWVWDGHPFAGRDVLVRCYHGLGDTLQFCRYLAPLRRAARSVTLEVQAELLPLLRDLPDIDRLHPFDHAAPLPPAECDIEIMELAHALRLRPDPAPYLKASPWPGQSGGLGLCWQSGGWDPARSIPPELLRPLLPGTQAVTLQRGPAAAAADMLGAVDPLDGRMDIVALARLLVSLDAVVTVDTMVAHLAGALGRPTFVLLHHTPDWRWGGAGEGRCIWYSSIRTFRQPRPGDWPGVIDALLATLIAH